MTFNTWLRLGRVSNLPTVWSNVLGALALSQAKATAQVSVSLATAMSAAYVGGMCLNDVFDREVDARERPNRPIPAGEVSATVVCFVGFGLLGASLAGVRWAAAQSAFGNGWSALGSAAVLCCVIVLYNLFHKGNPLSPVLMGLCRFLVYTTTALTVNPGLTVPLLLGALGLLCHIVGLTYAAKQESLGRVRSVWPLMFLAASPAYGIYLLSTPSLAWAAWVAFVGYGVYSLRYLFSRQARSIPGGVVRLIAAISLLDAFFAAAVGALFFVPVCTTCWLLTRLAQRVIPGT
jgi:UbiA prenyltransferase family